MTIKPAVRKEEKLEGPLRNTVVVPSLPRPPTGKGKEGNKRQETTRASGAPWANRRGVEVGQVGSIQPCRGPDQFHPRLSKSLVPSVTTGTRAFLFYGHHLPP